MGQYDSMTAPPETFQSQQVPSDPGPWAPPLDLQPEVSQLDRQLVRAYCRALWLHEGRWLVVPRVVTRANPPVGQDFNVQVPPGVTWVVQTFTASLVTSGVVASRRPSWSIDDGTTTVWTAPSDASVAASTAFTFTLERRRGYVDSQSGVNRETADFPVLTLPGGFRIRTTTAAIDAGDQWQAIAAYVLEVRARQPNERAAYVEALESGTEPELFPLITLGV